MKNLIIIISLFLISCDKIEPFPPMEQPTYSICRVEIDSINVRMINDSMYNFLYCVKYIEDMNGYRNDSDPIYLKGRNRFEFPIKDSLITLKLYGQNCGDIIEYISLNVWIEGKHHLSVVSMSGNEYITILKLEI